MGLQRHGRLFQNSGGWPLVKAMCRAQDHIKNGERILGDKEFIQFVLDLVKRIEKVAKSKVRFLI
jgi:hypothetical protein